ncbi:MAG: AraC family transcriptional regulator [Actinomycetota bacterium]
MVAYRQQTLPTPDEVGYEPPAASRGAPYQVLERAEVLAKKSPADYPVRRRAGFHQLILCTGGEGSHVVDFEPVAMRRGTLLRIHPGQVQRFVADASFAATMVVWPVESHHADPTTPAWVPGSTRPSRWDLDSASLTCVLGWLDELRDEQARFDGSATSAELMETLLRSLLLRVARRLPAAEPTASQLPEPYLAFRAAIEHHLHERPKIGALASSIGYSTRTLDRACHFAVGMTAKQVLDERVALEVRRLLIHTDRSVAGVGRDLGFSDASNFSKFVKRQLGQPPSVVREAGGRGADAAHRTSP